MGELLEFRSPIPVETPLGCGWAVLYESGTESWWTVILNDTRAFVTFRQSEILASRSYSYGRDISHDEMREILAPGALRRKPPRRTLPRTNKPRVRPRKSGKA